MSKVVIVKKANSDCPACKNLEMFLNLALSGKYNDLIEFVKQDEDQAKYDEYVEKYGIMSMPAIIDVETDKVVATGFNPGATVDYFNKFN